MIEEITLGAKLLGLLKRAWPYLIAALAIATVIGMGVSAHKSAVKAAYKAAYQQGVDDTKAAFVAAQAKADAAQRARNATTVKQQTKIDQEKTHALTRTYDSIDARARAISLRHEAAARDRASRPGSVSAASNAATGACPAPAEDGLPWSIAFPLMVQAERDQAQLNAVLDWEDAQAKLDAETRAPDPSQPQE